jgi:hypothetical protein
MTILQEKIHQLYTQKGDDENSESSEDSYEYDEYDNMIMYQSQE